MEQCSRRIQLPLVPIDISANFHASTSITTKFGWSIYKMHTIVKKACSWIYEVLRTDFIVGPNLFPKVSKFILIMETRN